VNAPHALPERSWVDGREAGEISALDRGLHYGDGLFETMACVGGGVRFLGEHLQRLASGCERLGIPAPDAALLRREIAVATAGAPQAVLKLILTRGAARARGYAATGEEQPTRVLLRYPGPLSVADAPEGVRVRIARLRLAENPALAGIKHLNRLEQVLARFEWTDPAIAEALMFSVSGALVSGTMSNVFLVRQGKLLTPRLDRCGVAGVMRAVVAALASQAGIDFEKRVLGAEDLREAQELFLTNALTGIRPIRDLAGRALGVGPLTQRLQHALAPLLARAAEAP
jgi:4-amino-4-deoxychorismate lyase